MSHAACFSEVGLKFRRPMNKQDDKQISAELEAFMLLNKLQSLEELLLIPDEVLVEMPGFGWHLLKEILLLRKIQ